MFQMRELAETILKIQYSLSSSYQKEKLVPNRLHDLIL